MDPAIETQDLGPPPPAPVFRRGLPVAILAHALLAVALAWGVQWKRQPDLAATAMSLPRVTANAPSTTAMGAGPAAVPQRPPQQQGPQPPRRALPVAQAPTPAAAARAPASPALERVPPSFDCHKARSVPERIICADPDLSRQDRELGRLYARARKASPDAVAFRRRSDARWFDRERQCRDRECLLRWYAQRREELMADLGEQPARR